MKRVITVVVIMAVSLSYLACSKGDRKSPELSKSDTGIYKEESAEKIISAYDLLDVFHKNKVQAEKTYTGKSVEVSGVVTYKGPDIHSLPSIELSDSKTGSSYVLCVFPSYDSMNKLSVGDKVSVSGEFHILGTDDWVVLKQCRII
ncbi:OB-fold putative lipoprotein [Sebaldella sp. S0638]|uniref:OB-fold putative lipoprotein n=1 Tax=Sebaldella sp. S0638 TaxID=2957809 RepID=UPI00209ECF0B|nr:OB-fold putative lipoprotein [Sebaldella sp. S0638]MCP1223540.1 OB-fold putative lipoprotein [Sebaldella sp. S0638]